MDAGAAARPDPVPDAGREPLGPEQGPAATLRPPSPLALPAAAALVAAGGSLGVLARALLVTAFPVAPGGWPWTTAGINVAGSFVLGALLAALRHGPDVGRRRAVRLGVGTGVLGGFTTYSTFALEVEQLLAAGRAGVGVAYALLSLVAGVAAAVAGAALMGRATRAAAPAARTGAGPDAADPS